jgi:hypothetical protein
MYALIDVLGDSLPYEALVEDVDDGWPLARLDLQHLADQISEWLAVHLIDWWV